MQFIFFKKIFSLHNQAYFKYMCNYYCSKYINYYACVCIFRYLVWNKTCLECWVRQIYFVSFWKTLANPKNISGNTSFQIIFTKRGKSFKKAKLFPLLSLSLCRYKTITFMRTLCLYILVIMHTYSPGVCDNSSDCKDRIWNDNQLKHFSYEPKPKLKSLILSVTPPSLLFYKISKI